MRLVRGIRGVPLSLVALVLPDVAHAACNLIPGTARSFPGTLGALNRPFAAPGEPLEVVVRPCDGSSGLGPTGPEHVVSVVFKPAAGGTGKLVAVATDCSAVDTASCSG